MLEINTIQNRTCKTIELKGRIDGITSSQLEKEVIKLTSEGSRTLAVNLANVNYVSSAGLRIFLSSQKMLKKIGGELILFSLQPQITDLFRTSGFTSLFRMFSSETDFLKDTEIPVPENKFINGMNILYKKFSPVKGKVYIIGSQDKLQEELFESNDIIKINSEEFRYATGMAVLGDDYNEFKELFGETVIINNNFFSYPAVKKSAVDFMLKGELDLNMTYNFLYGFGFNGTYSCVMKLPEEENYISLNQAAAAAMELSDSNIFGIVLIAESAGIYAMNLRKSPVKENKPERGAIFDQGNFADWIDFPLEPSYSNNIIAAAGIIVKDRHLLNEKYKSVTAEDSDSHIHCIVFEKDFLSKNIDSFDDELNRIMKELQPQKVQHLLGKSKFKSGMLAIIELEEF